MWRHTRPAHLNKGYAFITVCDKESSTNATVSTNNTKFNGRVLKCYWANNSCAPNQWMAADGPAGSVPEAGRLSYEEVFNQSSITNCRMYCGGRRNVVTEELVMNIFSPFGVAQVNP